MATMQDIKKWRLVPKYLIHIPIPYFEECEECGHRTIAWTKKGIIQIGTQREYYNESPLMKFYDRLFMDRAMPNLLMPPDDDSLQFKNGSTLRFHKYNSKEVDKLYSLEL